MNKILGILLLLSLIIAPLGIVAHAQTLGYAMAITIYNSEPYTVYNATIHLVFTPNNFTFPVNTSSIYFLDSNGDPLYFAVNIPQLDARIEYGLIPGFKYGGEPVNYTIYQPSTGWYLPSFTNFTNWTVGNPPFTNVNKTFNTLQFYQYFLLLENPNYPATIVNFTNIWIRAEVKPPNTTINGITYRLYKALLSIGYQNSNFTVYLNGNFLADNENLTYKYNWTWVLGSVQYNTTYENLYGIIDITPYVGSTPFLIALHENFTWLLENTVINSTFADLGVSYILVPDYSNYLSIWVKVPELKPGYNTIYMYYGGANPYYSYNDPEKAFIMYDNFNTNTTRWLWVNNYIIQNGELIHTYGDRTTILWYPVNITLDYSITLVVKSLQYCEGAGTVWRDWTILASNQTLSTFDPSKPVYAFVSNVMEGDYYGYTFYNWSKWWLSGNNPPLHVPFIYTHIERYNGVGFNVTDDKTSYSFYNNTANPSQWLKHIYYIGIDPKGFYHLDIIVAYITDPGIQITNTTNYELIGVTTTATSTVTVTSTPSYGVIITSQFYSAVVVLITMMFVAVIIYLITIGLNKLRGVVEE